MSVRASIVLSITAIVMFSIYLYNERFIITPVADSIYILDTKTKTVNFCNSEKCKIVRPDKQQPCSFARNGSLEEPLSFGCGCNDEPKEREKADLIALKMREYEMKERRDESELMALKREQDAMKAQQIRHDEKQQVELKEIKFRENEMRAQQLRDEERQRQEEEKRILNDQRMQSQITAEADQQQRDEERLQEIQQSEDELQQQMNAIPPAEPAR